MTPASALVIGFASLTSFLTLVWAIQLRRRNAGMVDLVWFRSRDFLGLLYALFDDARVAFFCGQPSTTKHQPCLTSSH